MATNKPNVRRYDDMGSGQTCHISNMHESDDGDYVLYEDYKALQAVCDHYKNAIAEIATRHSVDRWANTSSDKELEQYLSDGIAQLEGEYRKQIEALQAECEKLLKHLQSLIDQTTPLEPEPGNPRWSRRIHLDEVIAERDQLRAECELLRAAIRRLCNIYVVDDYYDGQMREDRLDEAVSRAIEQVKETTK